MRTLLRKLVVSAFNVLVARPLLYGFVGVRYRRKSLVPKGPCLVVANHNSHLDATILANLFPVRRLPDVHPVAAADYFGKTWLRRTFAMLFVNAVPIERKAQPGTDALAPLIRALKEGKTLVFFPEGSRGEAGVVGTFRSGVGHLVRAVPGLLVVPVFLSGPERIWPRGRAIPLPLGTDVNVGRPRTYSPDAEPRAIADEVRRDVLALAPPPPPVPRPRPSPPVRIAVCSIDAASRRAIFFETLRRIGKVDQTVGLGESFWEVDAEGVREATGAVPVARSRAWLGLLAGAFRTGGMFRGSRFAEMIERARMDESLEDGRTARFVVEDGNALADMMAWAEAELYRGVFDERGLHHMRLYLSGQRRLPFRQWWNYVRKAPEVWLLNTFDLARLRAPDVLVLLRVDPADAMRWRRSRGESLEPYENEPFLAKLQEAYVQVAEMLRRGGVEVVSIEGADIEPVTAGEIVERACARFRETETNSVSG